MGLKWQFFCDSFPGNRNCELQKNYEILNNIPIYRNTSYKYKLLGNVLTLYKVVLTQLSAELCVGKSGQGIQIASCSAEIKNKLKEIKTIATWGF